MKRFVFVLRAFLVTPPASKEKVILKDSLRPLFCRSGTVLFCCLAVSLTVLSCSKKGTEAEARKGTFHIHRLGVVFGPWDRATNRAGDFIFSAKEQKVFLEFGAAVSASGGGTKELPTFEYRIAKDACVTAVAEGKITRFVYQNDTQDYEIGTRSTADPDWEIGYDHVTHPRVAMGGLVEPGTVLGNPGTWNDELGRFEIMINNTATGLSYCPLCVFDPDSAEAYGNKVLRFMSDWESFKKDTTIYDEKRQAFPGCRYESMETY